MLAVFGVPGGSGSAHVVQFGPVGIESGRSEIAPEAANPIEPCALLILFSGLAGG